MNNLAVVLNNQGENEESETYHLQALDIRRKALGDDHPLVANSLNNLSLVYYDQGRFDEALDYSRQALDAYRRAYSGDHPDIAYGLQNLAEKLIDQSDYESAEAMLDEALAMILRILPGDHPDLGITRSGLAALYLETGRPDLALDMATAAHDILAQAYGDTHWRTAWSLSLQGAALAALGRHLEAEPLVVAAYETMRDNSGARPVYIEKARLRVVALSEAINSPVEIDTAAETTGTDDAPKPDTRAL
jgi:tetratricopeptide (TPR) repeat protein